MEVSGETLETHRLADTLVNRRMLEGMAATYLTDASPSDSQANLLKANLAGLPPVFVNAGSSEVLLSDTTRIADDALANIAR